MPHDSTAAQDPPCSCDRDFLALPGYQGHLQDVHRRTGLFLAYRSPFAGRR